MTVIASNGISQTLGVFNNGGSSSDVGYDDHRHRNRKCRGPVHLPGRFTRVNECRHHCFRRQRQRSGININFSSPTIRNSIITSSGVGIEVNNANDTPPWDIVTIDTSQIHSEGSTLVNNFAWPGMTTVHIGASQLAGGDIVQPLQKSPLSAPASMTRTMFFRRDARKGDAPCADIPTHNLAERLSLRRTGRPVSLALAALVVLFLAWLIFSTGGAVTAQTGGDYTLTKSVISGGGGELTGGSYTLAGIIGQPDAGALTGGNYTLGGGFWSGAAACITSTCRW